MEMSHLIRKQLDRKLTPLKTVARIRPPKTGWVRAIRAALAMPALELARRMKLSSKSQIYAIEKAEARGAVTLKTLARAAEAMDCTLVYALVPNQSLEKFVEKQALLIAQSRLDQVDQTMRLERQQTSAKERADSLKRLAQDYLRDSPKWFWNPR
jgi:predicted DNA-binding mobile mystery protein A